MNDNDSSNKKRKEAESEAMAGNNNNNDAKASAEIKALTAEIKRLNKSLKAVNKENKSLKEDNKRLNELKEENRDLGEKNLSLELNNERLSLRNIWLVTVGKQLFLLLCHFFGASFARRMVFGLLRSNVASKLASPNGAKLNKVFVEVLKSCLDGEDEIVDDVETEFHRLREREGVNLPCPNYTPEDWQVPDFHPDEHHRGHNNAMQPIVEDLVAKTSNPNGHMWTAGQRRAYLIQMVATHCRNTEKGWFGDDPRVSFSIGQEPLPKINGN